MKPIEMMIPLSVETLNRFMGSFLGADIEIYDAFRRIINRDNEDLLNALSEVYDELSGALSGYALLDAGTPENKHLPTVNQKIISSTFQYYDLPKGSFNRERGYLAYLRIFKKNPNYVKFIDFCQFSSTNFYYYEQQLIVYSAIENQLQKEIKERISTN